MASAWFPVDRGGKYRIELKIRGGNGSMRPINILLDSGNDITILTIDTAMKLGLDPHALEGDIFPVGGISGEPGMFRKIMNLIQIGDLRPIWIPMGLGMQDGILYEDLAGRAGIFDSGIYAVTQDESGVTFTEKGPQVAMLANSGGRISGSYRAAIQGSQGAWW